MTRRERHADRWLLAAVLLVLLVCGLVVLLRGPDATPGRPGGSPSSPTPTRAVTLDPVPAPTRRTGLPLPSIPVQPSPREPEPSPR